MIELITWITDPKKLPDDETTVLVCTESGTVSEGFHLEEHWFFASAGSIDENVIAWADMPEGPKVKPAKKRKGRAAR